MYPFNTSMEQMANVNNRYVSTTEEVKLFLALIEGKNITAISDGKQQCNSTIYQDLRESMLSKGYDKPENVCSFPLQPLDGNVPNLIFFFANFLKIRFTF